MAENLTIRADSIQWLPLIPGAEFAVLLGDPEKAGSLYVVRFKTPQGFRVPPHWHPEDEHVTVLRGTFGIGFGEAFDPAAVHYLPTGSYSYVAKQAKHFAVYKEQTIVQVHGIGPYQSVYVNPADDLGDRVQLSR